MGAPSRPAKPRARLPALTLPFSRAYMARASRNASASLDQQRGNAGLGVYHAGVEWKLWAGPQECSGALEGLGTAGGLIDKRQSISVVRCDEAAWRFLGLSLAGYNVLISLALAAIAAWGAAMEWRSGGLNR